MGRDSDQGIFVLDNSSSSGDQIPLSENPSANSWEQVNGALTQASAAVRGYDNSESDEDVILDSDDWLKELDVMLETSPTSGCFESDDEEDYDLTEPERVAKRLCKALESTFDTLKTELEYLQNRGAEMPPTLFTVSLLELTSHSTKLLPKLTEAMPYVSRLPETKTKANCFKQISNFLELIEKANKFFKASQPQTTRVALVLKEEETSSPARRSPSPPNPEGPFWFRLSQSHKKPGLRKLQTDSNMAASIDGFPTIRLSQSFT